MKRCTICKIEKDIGEFNKNKVRLDGFNNICRPCSNARSKRYYSEKREHHKAVIKEKKQRLRGIAQKRMVEFLLGKKCQDCGITDFRVLEFDHKRDKFKNVSDLMSNGYKWETIETEISKCDIVCSNCHKIRTHDQQKSYRAKYFEITISQ